MSINLPDTPTLNQVFIHGSVQYRWTGTVWADNVIASISYDAVTNKPTEFPPSAHNHVVSQITDVTATAVELNHTDGVTSNIQTQLEARVLETNGAVTTAATDQNVVRNITLSTADPTGGADGDVWLKYTA
jgi:hypothetical protein